MKQFPNIAAIPLSMLMALMLFLCLPVSAAVVDEFHDAAVIETSKITEMSSLVEAIKTHRVVFVGETHPSVEDHMLQMHVLETMAAQGRPLAIGVEWFQKPFQYVLDKYIDGSIDERELLRDTEYYQRWGFDYRIYRPMMRFAQKAGIPVLALNIEREITDNMMRSGIEGLPESQQEKLPAEYDFSETAYTRLLRKMFGAPQSSGHGMNEGFQRFLEVQITWDEVMAESAATYLKDNPNTRMVLFVGRGHMHSGAIPQRLRRRMNIPTLSLLNYSPDTPFNDADYLVLGQEEALPPAGTLGITITARGDNAILVKHIDIDSNANLAGVKAGDRVLAINDTPVTTFADMKYALIDGLPGDTVRLLLLRDAGSAQERSLQVYFQLGE